MAQKSGVPGALRRQIMREGGYRCAVCGLGGREERFPRGSFGYPTTMANVYLSIDHIQARSRGGTNDRANLRILCTMCNTRKGVRGA